MINSLNIVMPIRLELKGGKIGIFMVDLANQIVFDINGEQVSTEIQEEIMNNMRDQQEATMPEIPYDKIYEVMNTEKKLTEENNKHVFRRED